MDLILETLPLKRYISECLMSGNNIQEKRNLIAEIIALFFKLRLFMFFSSRFDLVDFMLRLSS